MIFTLNPARLRDADDLFELATRKEWKILQQVMCQNDPMCRECSRSVMIKDQMPVRMEGGRMIRGKCIRCGYCGGMFIKVPGPNKSYMFRLGLRVVTEQLWL